MGDGRVYLPVTPAVLRRARDAGRFEPPLAGHAVTPALEATWADEGAETEDLEYVAMTAAAVDALSLLGEDDRPRRLVAAVDVAAWTPADGPDVAPSSVLVTVPVPFRRLAAVHADSDDAVDDVRAAARLLAEGADEQQVDAAVERCLEHELGWYAAQELDALLD